MHDRQVRRRRAVLAALVALSLFLLTAYFGESAGGGLHAIQRGALEVLGPIEEGANRALKPFRDLFGWVGDTIDAKDERDQLKSERDRLQSEATRLQAERQENAQLRRLLEISEEGGLDRYEPVTARVTVRSPNLFYSTVNIDKGSTEGISVNDPVINGEGLVGRVTSVVRGASQVTLLTDEDFAVAARTLGSNEPGTIQPVQGAPGDLLFELVPPGREVREGERVVTAGTTSSRLRSLFPPNILIGFVRRVEIGEGDLQRRIHVRPAADLRAMQFVRVLTKPAAAELQANSGGASP